MIYWNTWSKFCNKDITFFNISLKGHPIGLIFLLIITYFATGWFVMGYRPLSFGICKMEGRFSDIRFDSTVFAECFPAKSFIFFHSSTCFPYSVKLRNSELLVVKVFCSDIWKHRGYQDCVYHPGAIIINVFWSEKTFWIPCQLTILKMQIFLTFLRGRNGLLAWNGLNRILGRYSLFCWSRKDIRS